MTVEAREKKNRFSGRKIGGIVLFVIAAVLILSAAAGYIMRGTPATSASLNKMRSDAVLHAASEGLITKIGNDAYSAKLADLRKNGLGDRSFRQIGANERDGILNEARDAARAEAERLYSNPVVNDPEAFEAAIVRLEGQLVTYGTRRNAEREAFAEIYVKLVDGIGDWTALVSAAGDDDEALFRALSGTAPELARPENAHLKESFVRLARDLAEKERAKAQSDLEAQLTLEINGGVSDWEALADLEDDALWEALCAEVPSLKENEGFREKALAQARANIETVRNGGEIAAGDSSATEGNTPVSETQADYRYFTATEALKAQEAEKNAAHEGLWAQLTAIIPSLAEIKSKDQEGILEDIDSLLWPGSMDFSSRFRSYSEELGGSNMQFLIRLAGSAENVLLLGTALLLLAMLFTWWEPLTGRFGVPRTIIFLFFIYLILAARYFGIAIPLMVGNVLERMVMYGILTLAMMPGIQCGIGLNMGMTIGCIAGLMGIVLSLQFDMTGPGGLVFACASGAVIALPLGWAYSLLLNRMKGSEMTISTYVGFSFVSLMCIGWMMLPFNNPKIIWLLSGQGLRVTHSLLGSYGHLLDKLLSFEIFGMKVPSGGLLFMGLCCLLMWLFSRTKVGIAMTAVGSNPRFAEASGINVNSMRSLGTVLSTVLAAIGIVIYSQSFGYAQLYTAPRQLGFIASSAILIGGASVTKAKVGHVLLGVFLFEGVLVFGQQVANAAVAGGGLSEVMRIMISNGIILYALTQTGGGRRE